MMDLHLAQRSREPLKACVGTMGTGKTYEYNDKRWLSKQVSQHNGSSFGNEGRIQNRSDISLARVE